MPGAVCDVAEGERGKAGEEGEQRGAFGEVERGTLLPPREVLDHELHRVEEAVDAVF